MKKRLLIVFVDALGPAQAELLVELLPGLSSQRSLEGVFGFSSGALATLLTGESPTTHGRMCLFTAARSDESPLSALTWLGVLPRAIHQRAALRRLVGRVFARSRGWDGYFALHRVPPEAFQWLDVPEREDLFAAARVGSAATFLSEAREAGLEVYTAPWQLPEAERWQHAHQALQRNPPELAFLYAAELDGALHRSGNDTQVTRLALERIARGIHRARTLMSRGGADVTTLVVGDHGMADVARVVDPQPIVDGAMGTRVFVDSTMLRFWGSDAALHRARALAERQVPDARWLDSSALAQLRVPVVDSPYGRAMLALPEGAIFAPSYVGGRVAGMHGYVPGGKSTRAALLSDRAIPSRVERLEDVAPLVRLSLGMAA